MTTLMSHFDFYQPASLDALFELVDGLESEQQKYLFSAGNTDLLPMFKKGINLPDCLVSLSALIELTGIELVDAKSSFQTDFLRIGAVTKLVDVINNPLVKQYFPELSRVASLVASPQIRNQATLGGNLLVDNRCIYVNQSEDNRSCHSQCFKASGDICHLVKSAKIGDKTLCQARFVSDTAPVLMLLDAKLQLHSGQGKRHVLLKDFYRQDGIENNCLKPGEVLVSIDIPVNQKKQVRYEKLAIRKTLDFASVGVAVAISSSLKNSQHFELEVALTGIQTLPGYLIFSSNDFENEAQLVDQACRHAEDFSLIYQQDYFPRAYRKKMIGVFVQRCFDYIKSVESNRSKTEEAND